MGRTGRALPLLLLLATWAVDGVTSEIIDNNDLERYCYPTHLRNTRSACECSNTDSPPWGRRAIVIDCSFKDMRSEQLSSDLPLYAETLDLSWNVLTDLPLLQSENLRQLNAMHNNISLLRTKNFAGLGRLETLFLSWNGIQVLELQAFEGLPYLKMLDLAHNNLQTLPALAFDALHALEALNLSWNRKLNETKDIAVKDFYAQFGVNSKLRSLNLDACNLRNLSISAQLPLQELSLRGNEFAGIPSTLPAALTQLDVSGNFLRTLTIGDTMHLTRLQVLYLEDMPRLEAIEYDALAPLAALQKLSLQNCRRLTSLNAFAFGVEPTAACPELRTIVLRGTMLHSLNATLEPIFAELYELDLKGVPLYCDCDLRWMKDLRIETQGRCFQPAALRGLLISEAEKSDFSCNRWPRWLTGMIILLLIVVFAVGVYLIVMGLRPHRGVTMRHKPGAGSPYARVTIEPNRQEIN